METTLVATRKTTLAMLQSCNTHITPHNQLLTNSSSHSFLHPTHFAPDLWGSLFAVSQIKQKEDTIWMRLVTRSFCLSRWLAVTTQPLPMVSHPQRQIRNFSKKPKASSRQWIERHVNDPFVKKAQENGKVSRSYYKLEFIDQKYGLFKSTKTAVPPLDNNSRKTAVVDLGAAPGGWTQYASERQGPDLVLAIDLLELDAKVAHLPNVKFLQGDFTKLVVANDLLLFVDEVQKPSVRMVLSDMAPNFIGDSRSDAIRTADLCEQALEFSFTVLEPGGAFVGKYFSGPEEKELKEMALQEFNKVVTVKPPASRNESSERYLVALGRR